MPRGRAVVVMDGDLQDPPEVLPQFVERWRQGYDVVYAVRRHRKEGPIKRLCYFLFYRLMNAISDIDIPLDSGDFCLDGPQGGERAGRPAGTDAFRPRAADVRRVQANGPGVRACGQRGRQAEIHAAFADRAWRSTGWSASAAIRYGSRPTWESRPHSLAGLVTIWVLIRRAGQPIRPPAAGPASWPRSCSLPRSS